MIEIQVNNLVKSFEVGHNVLDGVTFQIDQGQRVGLLGKNGAGKSTLFKILIGELDCDEGTVTISPGHRMGLISQIPVYPEGYTVDDVLRSAFGRLHALTAEMEELAGRMAAGETDPAILKRYGSLSERFEVFGGYDTDVAISKVANGLSISDDMRGRLFDQLSGGEKTRVNLGRLILEDTDILLLDEPTNHLDLHATEWLEAYIQKFRGTVVAISHDRYFLDRSVNRVIEIENGKAEFYSGNYSFYAVEKERRYQERMKQYEKEQAKIAQLEKSAEQLRMWAFQGMDKTYRRAISMERRIERMRTTAKPTKARKMDARFTAAEFHGDEVLGIRNLSKAYGEKPLFEGISLKVEGGERIALIGDNGTGKSTLIKMIADEVYPDSGRIRLGPQVKLAYLPQIIHFDHPDWNLVENMMAAKKGLSAQSARNRLAAYQFQGEDVFKSVSVLSGGELSRLRGRRGPLVARKVGEREVRLVADGRDDGNLRGVDGTHDGLLVEGPEVLHRAAATADDQHIDGVLLVEEGDGRGDLRGCLLALDEHGAQDELHRGPAALRDVVDVTQHGARDRGDDADALREARQGLLVRIVEEPLRCESRLELLEGEREVARALRHHVVSVELVDAVALVDRDAAADDDLHAVLRPEAQALRAAPEHHALDGRRGVLQREVAVARGVAAEVRQLPADLDAAEHGLALEHPLDIVRDLTDVVYPHGSNPPSPAFSCLLSDSRITRKKPDKKSGSCLRHSALFALFMIAPRIPFT